MSNRLLKVQSFDKFSVRNGVIMLILRQQDNSFILTVAHSGSGTVGLPGGRRKKRDKNAFANAKREYEEETGNKLTGIRIVEKFLWRGTQLDNDTAIFVVTPKIHSIRISDKLGKNSDGEVSAINIYSVNTIKKALRGKMPWKIRNFEKKSIGQIIEYLGF